MLLKDDVQIPLPRAIVFDALNDTDILKASIPGCETLTRVSVSLTRVSVSHPGMLAFKMSVSLSASNTIARGSGI